MHSFISVHVHCVWSTKNRDPSLHSKLRERLWPYHAFGGQNGTTTQRQFIQMDSRDVSRNAFV